MAQIYLELGDGQVHKKPRTFLKRSGLQKLAGLLAFVLVLAAIVVWNFSLYGFLTVSMSPSMAGMVLSAQLLLGGVVSWMFASHRFQKE